MKPKPLLSLNHFTFPTAIHDLRKTNIIQSYRLSAKSSNDFNPFDRDSGHPYDAFVARHFLVFLGCSLALWGLSTGVLAECELLPGPVPEAMRQLKFDLREVFERLGVSSNFLTPGSPEAETAPPLDEDRLIVPGRRAGSYEIDTTLAALSARVKLQAPLMKSDGRYVDLLPLGYIPERKFRESPKKDFLFAFDSESKLREIFIRTDLLRTSEGIGLGSSEGLVRKLSNIRIRIGKDRSIYAMAEGITFVLKGKRVSEIVVRKESTAR